MDHRSTGPEPASLSGFHERTLTRGVNPVLYWTLQGDPRAVLPDLLSHAAHRHASICRAAARCCLASNHRSFLDPFVIGTLVRRPVYYMAKRELFEHRLVAWLLNGLGAFPVDRGAGDAEAMETARAILARGDCVVLFPEGTRVRRGPLGAPRRGVGRLALQTGAPVAPVAVIGTEDVRRGWRIRPRKVRIRVGRPAPVRDRRACLADTRGLGHRARVGLRQPAVGLARRRGGRARRARTIARRARAPQARPQAVLAPVRRSARPEPHGPDVARPGAGKAGG